MNRRLILATLGAVLAAGASPPASAQSSSQTQPAPRPPPVPPAPTTPGPTTPGTTTPDATTPGTTTPDATTPDATTPASAATTPASAATPDATTPASAATPGVTMPDATPSDATTPASAATPAPAPPPGLGLRAIELHGFVSQGAFLSTDNDYIGRSSRGSLELFEAGINFSTEVADRLRAGIQLFARDYGDTEDRSPRIDWAFLDYRWRQWLGLRAGVIRMPYGLYNEYADIDAARVSILMPQGVYPFRNRDVLLSHRGFALYGNHDLGVVGGLEYAAWLGTLTIPENALTLVGAELDSIDTKYVAGGRVFWSPPVEGLRIGASVLRASIDFNLTLTSATTAQLIMLGLVPADFDGSVVISQRPAMFSVASLEYTNDDWVVAAEYSRGYKRQRTSLPELIPTFENRGEAFYGMVTKRMSERLELGGYYSVRHIDVSDRLGRKGRDAMVYAERFHAFQRDAAVTARININPYWLWKLEAHFIDGTADLVEAGRAGDERFWGLFLIKTTVTF